MDNKVVRIPSYLYTELYNRGYSKGSTKHIGDKLITVFCTLKAYHTNGRFKSFVAKNKVKVEGLKILRHKTNLSISVIEKYVPILIDLGLVNINHKGDVEVMGNNKLNQIYCTPATYTDKYGKQRPNKNAGKVKLIPVVLGSKLTDGADKVCSVRFMSNQQGQIRTLNVKIRQSEQANEYFKNKSSLTSREQKKAIKTILKKDKGEFNLTEKSVLSLQGFAKLKKGVSDNKSLGQYYKNKLAKKGIIQCTRRFKPVREVTYKEYSQIKKYCPDFTRRHTYKKGWLVEEVISQFEVIDLVNGVVKGGAQNS